MTITLYVVHIFGRGRYSRTLETQMDRERAVRWATRFNAKQADRADTFTGQPKFRALVEAVPILVTPPESEPAIDPFGPGIRPTRRTPAVV